MTTLAIDMGDPSASTSFAEIIAGAGAVAAALVVGINKAVAAFGKARIDTAHSGAQAEVVNGLREELVRMRTQNAELAETLNDLQKEVIHLRGENAELQETIQSLRSEVQRLRESNNDSEMGRLL